MVRKKGKDKSDIDSSINSGIDALAMSYNKMDDDNDGEFLTPEEKEEVAKLPKSTWKSFVSPAERKKQQKLKTEALAAKMKQEVEAVKKQHQADEEQEQLEAKSTMSRITEGDDEKSTGSESLTPEEKEVAEKIAKTTYVSPMERKRRQSLKLKEMEEKKKQEEQQQQTAASDGGGGNAPEEDIPCFEPSGEPSAGERTSENSNEVAAVAQDTTANTAAIEAQVETSSSPAAAGDGEDDEKLTSIPPEGDKEKAKRAAIQAVMKDTSLSPVERNQAIQKIIKGGVPDAAETSGEEGSSDEEEEGGDDESSSSGEWVTDSDEEETDSEDEESKLSEAKKKAGLIVEGKEEEQPTAQAAVAAASAVSTAQKTRVKELEAELDKELSNHSLLEEQQKQRELEFQREEQQRAMAREAAEEEVLRRVTAEKTASEKKLQGEIAALRMERERAEEQLRLQEETNRIQEESRRLRGETQREEARLRALQEERDRELRLAQAESRRLQDEQRRLQAERESEQRRLNQQADLHQRLERERLLRGKEQQEMGGQQQPYVARALPLRDDIPHRLGGDKMEETRSLRSSELLATRQGGGDYTRTTSTSSSSSSVRPPQRQGSQIARAGRYDGVDDDELNWRLDAYVSLSDYSIVINRARPGPYAPDFDTTDVTGIDFVTETSSNGVQGALKQDKYYVHKAMIAVGSRRSELLGRRIREAESRGTSPEATSEVNIHETVMLESAADAMGSVLDFCYYHDQPLDIHKENAVPLVYLGKRYKIRALLEQAEVYVMENIVSTTAMYFLLDSYLFQLEEILSRSIDVTAANLEDTVDFEPIYKLPPELFKRVILSKELKCNSELLSLIVYSYCGEHHPNDIDVEYFREVTKPRLMPNIDPKVALMVLKLYADLILADDPLCDIMEVLPGDSLINRCITVVAKHWLPEIADPMVADDNPTATSAIRTNSEPAALHRLLPPPLQNYVLEKCILAAKIDFDSQRNLVENFEARKREDMENESKSYGHIVKGLQDELATSNKAQGKGNEELYKQIRDLALKASELEKQLEEKTKDLEDYKSDLRQFRRVPGIHNFGEVSQTDPKIMDKTKCTYSANPDHHYPYHRRGNRPPTAMPEKGKELDNLAKENGYLFDDGKGELLPVFYYQKRSAEI